ncbi:hypothetical protein Vi05172_g5673 [Venturia inaequalis]|nr:hypothetical protein Vi05172_g5673 [Venturia inaequalis]
MLHMRIEPASSVDNFSRMLRASSAVGLQDSNIVQDPAQPIRFLYPA